jgi:xanthine dehydrogenase/oxidase
LSALQQCTGEAKYVDDMPVTQDTLHAAFVLSERAHAKLLSVDASAALALQGVKGFFSAKDIDEHDNAWGPILPDEQLFRRSEVTSTGQLIGVVVAQTQEQADAARRLVKVEYEDLEPVLTIEDAIRTKSFHQWVRRIDDGDVDAAFALPDTVIVEGEFRMGGQEHFYLETNACHVVPGEGDELTIYASTQAAMKTQKVAAHACGIQASKVVCKVKRMGGGFGGKETRTVIVSSAVAFAAHRLRRPVRINIERDQDMWITGTRHPFIGRYKLGADPGGKLRALDLQLYSNAGYSLDLSEPVLGRALLHCENVYKIPNLRAVGYNCMTNTTSNTAFRGFGGPQGLLVAEAYLEHMASKLKIEPEEMRVRNMYAADGDRTHFNQLLVACPVRRMYSDLSESAEMARRAEDVKAFNKANRWRKRGIALLPNKFGISFTAKFMNQGGALVHIYVDGTVLVTHGGTEMGQGLHTKICQITARALGVPIEDVYIRETSTDTVPNSSPTAASASSDLYGMAVLNACEQLKLRLAPYLEACGGDFKKAVNAGFFDRCDLSAHGYYKTPDIGYDWNIPNSKERGTPFRYFTYGAACAEVEIDCLTGDMRVLRADILMDLGNSLNPAIDIGQIEGAFMQGIGWTMLEEVVWGCNEFPWLKPGALFTRGPGTYKIPSFNDVPVDMRVTLFKDSANPTAIHSSRAVGEPPFFLGSVAFLAARQAIASARRDNGHPDEHFTVDTPLTPERIRMACGDSIAEGFTSKMSRPRPSGFW